MLAHRATAPLDPTPPGTRGAFLSAGVPASPAQVPSPGAGVEAADGETATGMGFVISVPRRAGRQAGGQLTCRDHQGLDAIGPRQQRHVLAGQQLADHDRVGDRIQRGRRRGEDADTVADCGPHSTQTPTSPLRSRMAGQMRCRPANSSASACSGARGPSKYSSRAWVGTSAAAVPRSANMT